MAKTMKVLISRTYSFAINGTTVTGEPVNDVSTIVTGRIDGVESQGLIFLLVGERAVPMQNVINVLEPQTVSTAHRVKCR